MPVSKLETVVNESRDEQSEMLYLSNSKSIFIKSWREKSLLRAKYGLKHWRNSLESTGENKFPMFTLATGALGFKFRRELVI